MCYILSMINFTTSSFSNAAASRVTFHAKGSRRTCISYVIVIANGAHAQCDHEREWRSNQNAHQSRCPFCKLEMGESASTFRSDHGAYIVAVYLTDEAHAINPVLYWSIDFISAPPVVLDNGTVASVAGRNARKI